MPRLFLILFTLFTLAISSVNAHASKRIALVVGNDTYQNVSVLKNSRTDARAVAAALRAAGFDVTLKTDVSEKAFLQTLRSFKARVEGGDEAVFYFSGHGVQIGSANYLLPVDIASDNEEQITDDAVPLQRVLDDLQDQKARFSLAIVDACRDNPFKGRGRNIGGRGLQPINPATGQMVLYSAGAGQQALDRLSDHDRDPNGLFTRILLKEIDRPGISVDRVLRNVRDQVVGLAKSVGHDQVPALYDQAIGEFYFKRGPAVADDPSPAPNHRPATPVVVDIDPGETAYWAEVKKSDDLDYYAAYLANYPNGRHVADANEYIERDKQAKAAREKLKEDQAWQKAQNGESFASYSTYLQSYPNGRYAKLAELRLKKLGGAARDCSDCPEMVQIPAGSFEMGSNDGDTDEKPVHRVSLNAFSMSKTEITNRQFRQFRPGHNSGDYEGNSLNGDEQPVARVSWEDAQAYVQWLASKTGQPYRLPTEAEWEYAARAGTTSKWIWGNDENGGCQYANIADQTAKSRKSDWTTTNCTDGYFVTAPVARFRANAFGLNDMTGNVWEWVEDCYQDSYSGAPTDGSVRTGGSCEKRVLRGGSWYDFPTLARAAFRFRYTPTNRSISGGFRVVRAARTF